MLRVIAQHINCGAAVNVGGPVSTGLKSFDVDLPEVEAWLSGAPDDRNKTIAAMMKDPGDKRQPHFIDCPEAKRFKK